MSRERLGIRPGDLLRCPDRATARWHRVVRVGRRKDGTRYVTVRRSRLGRLLGLSRMQRLEWSMLRGIGFGIRRARAPLPMSDPAAHDWPNPPKPPTPEGASE